MTMPHARMSSDEIAERGQALFERDIRSTVEAKDCGKFLVLDVESGAYEIDRDELVALERMRSRKPEGALYVLRIGHPTAYHLGRGRFTVQRC